jgi:hypothetical protein
MRLGIFFTVLHVHATLILKSIARNPNGLTHNDR